MRHVLCVLAVSLCIGCSDIPFPSGLPAPPPRKAVNEPPDVQSRILAELQEQNRLLRLEQEKKEAEKAWESELEALFQKWASLQANKRDALDKANFEFDQNIAKANRDLDVALGKGISITPTRSWTSTYGQLYPRFLEEYRKLCGKMTKEELRKFAKDNSLPWGN
jgi:hypothetical protein